MNVPVIILVGIPTGNKLPLNEKMHFIICETRKYYSNIQLGWQMVCLEYGISAFAGV